jgi:hypothetical protein
LRYEEKEGKVFYRFGRESLEKEKVDDLAFIENSD